MKKLCLLMLALMPLAACSTEQEQQAPLNEEVMQDESLNTEIKQEEPTVYEDERIKITFPEGYSVDGFAMDNERGIAFGEKGQAPEAPLGEEARPFYVNLISPRSFEEIQGVVGNDPINVVRPPESSMIGELEVATWVLGGMCNTPILEVMTEEFNLFFQANCFVGEEEALQKMEEVVSSMEVK